MDFYFDIGIAVILRIISDRRNAPKYYRALAKLLFKLSHMRMVDPGFAHAYESYVKEQGGE